MKKVSMFFLSLVFFVLMTSCKKESTGGPEINDDPYPTAEYGVVDPECTDHQLVHYPAVAPTANKAGNLEYWFCPNCNTYYKDGNGNTRYEMNTPFLRAKNRNIDRSILEYRREVFRWRTTKETKGLIDGISAGCSILSCVLSIVTFVDMLISDEDDKTEEYFNEIMAGIEDIDDDIQAVHEKTEEILDILEDAPYEYYINEINSQTKFIWEQTMTFMPMIENEMDNYNEGSISEDTFAKNVRMILRDWSKRTYGSEQEDIYHLVTRMVMEYDSVSIENEWKNFPQISRRYSQSYSPFDNLVYPDRANLNRYVEFTLATGYYLACMYRDNILKNDPIHGYSYDETRKHDSSEFRRLYQKMIDIVCEDSVNMNKAYENYRVFRENDATIYFEPRVYGCYDFYKWIRNHHWNDNAKCASAFLPGDNYSSKATTYSQKMWDETTGSLDIKEMVTRDDLNKIYGEYNPSTSSTQTSLYYVFNTYAEIADFPLQDQKVSISSGQATPWLMYSLTEDKSCDCTWKQDKYLTGYNFYHNGFKHHGYTGSDTSNGRQDIYLKNIVSTANQDKEARFAYYVNVYNVKTSDMSTQWGAIKHESTFDGSGCGFTLKHYSGDIYE